MNKFYWKKTKETTDLSELTKEILIELSDDLKSALRNGNTKRAQFINSQIDEIQRNATKTANT